MVNIFAYGSLMFDSVRDALINCHYKKLDAHINGFRRLSVRGKLYPGLIESQKGRVGGVLLLGINDSDLRALD
ncbi:MAG: gamma-glutamylcyclotransferase [Gammaproteobacteria bacterium]|nr:gamma-glutamylcyclotransferase [Gammaproteobacteria bacterium]